MCPILCILAENNMPILKIIVPFIDENELHINVRNKGPLKYIHIFRFEGTL